MQALPTPTGPTLGMQSAGKAPQFFVDQAGSVKAPWGLPEVVFSGDSPNSVLGWAVDPEAKMPGAGVDVVIDGNPYFATYGVPRTDVSAALKVPGYTNSGFACDFGPRTLPPGDHKMTIRLIRQDMKSYLESVPQRFTVR